MPCIPCLPPPPPTHLSRAWGFIRRPGTCLLLLALAGCTPSPQPLDGYNPSAALRASIINDYREYLASTRLAHVSSDPPPGDVEAFLAKEGNLAEADRLSGPASYTQNEPDPGADLLGRFSKVVQPISLQQAVVNAMESGLDPRIARLGPIIADAKTEQARGAFDPTVFGETGTQRSDTPSALAGQSADTRSDSIKAGVKQKYLTGTLAEISGNFTHNTRIPNAAVDPWYESGLGLQITQPLLRGAGLAVNRSEMDLARNAADIERERLRATLLKTTADATEAYWRLAQHRDEVLIQERLVQRTHALAERLRPRLGHDVLGADMAQVITRLSSSEGDLDTARAALRDGSDQLKRLMDTPLAPLASERLLLPQDHPQIKELKLDLAEAMRLAIACRPDLAEASFGITDSDLRLLVAKNAQLPLTDIRASVNLHALDGNAGTAVSHTLSDSTDAAISLRFEQALGTRTADAQVAEQRAGHRRTMLVYRRVGREALLEVKTAMRKVILAHDQISRTRATRRAAAEALRVAENRLQENPAGGDSYTTLIDRILDRQGTLGQAEMSEARARYDFVVALARLDEAMGVSMDRFGVQTKEPPPDSPATKPAATPSTAPATPPVPPTPAP